jgi:tetratricopeptide (TPR) repeat protein
MIADLLARAEYEFASDNLTGALDLYEQALAADRTAAPAWVGKARVLAAFGALGEAEDAYFNAVEADPNLVEAWVELIKLEREAGATDAANENLNSALRVLPGHAQLLELKGEGGGGGGFHPLQKAMARIREMIFDDDIFGAAQELDRMELMDRDNPLCLVAHGELTLATGKGNLAQLIQRLSKASQAHPDNWEVRAMLGRLYLLKGPFQNPKMAAALCEDAWRISGENPRAGLGLIEAWTRLKKQALAEALAKKIAEGEGLEAVLVRRFLGME